MYSQVMVIGRVRKSTVFGLAVALLLGVASGWMLSERDQGEAETPQESWLFSHTADSGEIREREDGSLELILRSIDAQVTAFTDRPFRDAKIETVEWLVSSWDEFFADSPPNAVLVEHEPQGVARSVVVELTSPQLMGDELTYALTVLDAVPDGRLARVAGASHENPVRTFRAVSLFIDDVSLSCAKGGSCAVGDAGPGGGVVFYVDDAGKYLETPRADTSREIKWSDAVKNVQKYRGGGKSDWYLPNSTSCIDRVRSSADYRLVVTGVRQRVIRPMRGCSFWMSADSSTSLKRQTSTGCARCGLDDFHY
jgi:hypothetical protein